MFRSKRDKRIAKAIKLLAKNDWFGFKLTKHNRGADMALVFCPGKSKMNQSIIPIPKNLVQAAASVRWLLCPSDNLDGVPKTKEEKQVTDE